MSNISIQFRRDLSKIIGKYLNPKDQQSLFSSNRNYYKAHLENKIDISFQRGSFEINLPSPYRYSEPGLFDAMINKLASCPNLRQVHFPTDVFVTNEEFTRIMTVIKNLPNLTHVSVPHNNAMNTRDNEFIEFVKNRPALRYIGGGIRELSNDARLIIAKTMANRWLPKCNETHGIVFFMSATSCAGTSTLINGLLNPNSLQPHNFIKMLDMGNNKSDNYLPMDHSGFINHRPVCSSLRNGLSPCNTITHVPQVEYNPKKENFYIDCPADNTDLTREYYDYIKEKSNAKRISFVVPIDYSNIKSGDILKQFKHLESIVGKDQMQSLIKNKEIHIVVTKVPGVYVSQKKINEIQKNEIYLLKEYVLPYKTGFDVAKEVDNNMLEYKQKYIKEQQDSLLSQSNYYPKPSQDAITQCIKRIFQESPDHKDYSNISISIINVQPQTTIDGAITPDEASF